LFIVASVRFSFGQGLRIFQIAYGAYIRNEDDPGYRKDHERMLPEDKLGEGGREEMDVPGGVTDLGKQAIKKMNQLHMLIDCSHCGNRTTLETTQLSKTPVIANHSASSEVVKGGFWPIGHWRNKTDEALRAIAEKGGVIGVTPIRWMLSTQN
jgi:microsomal dipeptidase-like Zn-dependent dipeptidase